MILAYHKLSSDQAFVAVTEAGQIIPAAYRLQPDQINKLCGQFLERFRGTPVGDALAELIEEALDYFAARRVGEGTRETALKCEDILAGDAGRVFLSPGNWTEAGRGLGYPNSGFAFDVEQLIGEGAAYRPDDIGYVFRNIIETVAGGNYASSEEAKWTLLKDFAETLVKRQVYGEEALAALEVYRLRPGDEKLPPYERRQRSWHRGDEIVWDGPLPLDWAVEVWRNDKMVTSKLLSEVPR